MFDKFVLKNFAQQVAPLSLNKYYCTFFLYQAMKNLTFKSATYYQFYIAVGATSLKILKQVDPPSPASVQTN